MENGIIYVTAKGKKVLETRLAELISKRGDAADAIREAREFGDLKENAEYAAAREFQTNLENEIIDIQDKLENLKVINPAKVDASCVNIGTTVTVQEVGGKKAQEWRITGVIEGDAMNHLISNESPLGKQLLGKRVGEVVEVHTPGGTHKYKIVNISAGI
jgi:transcription elongation factor GreA